MNYESFVEHVKELIKEELPEGWEQAMVTTKTTDKVNQKRIGLGFEKSDGDSATVYLEEFYEGYRNGMNLEEVIENLRNVLFEVSDVEQMKITRDSLREKKDRIVFQLINTQSNKALLDNRPHREFQDLSIIYMYYLSHDENGLFTIPVENGIAALYDLSEETLFELAYENTKRLLPIEAIPMREMINNLIQGMDAEIENEEIIEQGGGLYVFTNHVKSFGAVAMLYPEKFDEVAKIQGDDLYIIPSSRHEVITLPKGEMALEDVIDMMKMANETHNSIEDELSHQVYLYDRSTRGITQITNLPHRAFCEEEREAKKEEVRERNMSR